MVELPSLFRWEPTMWLIDDLGDRGVVVGMREQRITEHGFALQLRVHYGLTDAAGEPLEVDLLAWAQAAECRPDMSHAGTRGLVLEQVRAALGDPGACPRMVFDTTVERWRWRFDWSAIFDTEGEAVLDALHRAESRS